MLKYFLLLTFILISISLKSQHRFNALGARINGMGQTSICITDIWSGFNNPGILSELQEPSLGSTYQYRYGIVEFQTLGFIANLPTKYIHGSISAYRFGSQLYNQQKTSISLSNKIDKVNLGISIHRVQYYIQDFGQKAAFTYDWGGVYHISKQLRFGFVLVNILGNNILPSELRTGMSYIHKDKLQLNIEVNNTLNEQKEFHIGLEYSPLNWVQLRIGSATNSFPVTTGIGISPGNFGVDYSFANHISGLAVHEVSLNYLFKSSVP